jgi:hypothetical protein
MNGSYGQTLKAYPSLHHVESLILELYSRLECLHQSTARHRACPNIGCKFSAYVPPNRNCAMADYLYQLIFEGPTCVPNQPPGYGLRSLEKPEHHSEDFSCSTPQVIRALEVNKKAVAAELLRRWTTIQPHETQSILGRPQPHLDLQNQLNAIVSRLHEEMECRVRTRVTAYPDRGKPQASVADLSHRFGSIHLIETRTAPRYTDSNISPHTAPPGPLKVNGREEYYVQRQAPWNDYHGDDESLSQARTPYVTDSSTTASEAPVKSEETEVPKCIQVPAIVLDEPNAPSDLSQKLAYIIDDGNIIIERQPRRGLSEKSGIDLLVAEGRLGSPRVFGRIAAERASDYNQSDLLRVLRHAGQDILYVRGSSKSLYSTLSSVAPLAVEY